MAAEGYHEALERLTAPTQDLHRAIRSLMEELEAIDWYQQRVDACQDDDLRAILAHNRDEEKEHAAMVLEWIRRRDATFDGHLRTYLFSEGSITGREATKENEAGGKEKVTGKRGSAIGNPPAIGSLRPTERGK